MAQACGNNRGVSHTSSKKDSGLGQKGERGGARKKTHLKKSELKPTKKDKQKGRTRATHEPPGRTKRDPEPWVPGIK